MLVTPVEEYSKCRTMKSDTDIQGETNQFCSIGLLENTKYTWVDSC